MDDLSAALQKLLSAPDTPQKLQNALAQLGLGSDEGSSAAPPAAAPEPEAALTALAPLLRSFSSETDDTRLLRALRPFLHGARAKRLEEADRMLRLRALLPVLQQSGLWDQLTGGGDRHG
ncbi:MAG: hypothetical protein IKI50_00885 [Clostridia bacterium]|nr:hypothetical protein [Clostridia bacterium]